jgi:hypothetical protein
MLLRVIIIVIAIMVIAWMIGGVLRVRIKRR